MEERKVDQQMLPSDRAFVVQFRQKTDAARGRFDGRLEHVTSGRAALFHSLDELVRYLKTMLPPSGRSEGRGTKEKRKAPRRW